jgi:hypothetical protein
MVLYKLPGQDRLASTLFCGKERGSCACSRDVVWACLFSEGKEDSKRQSFTVDGNDWLCLLLFWSVGGLHVLSIASLEGL